MKRNTAVAGLLTRGVRACRRAGGKLVRHATLKNRRAAARLRKSPALIVLCYHEVWGGDSNEPRYPGTGVLADELRTQLAWCMANFPIIRLADGIRLLRSGKLDSTRVAITFDDGHVGVEKHAYPILKELDAPATIFLSARFLDDADANWLLKVLRLLRAGHEQQVRALFDCPEAELLTSLRWAQGREVYDRLGELDRLYADVFAAEPQPWYLGRSFLKAEAGRLLDIGGHGYSHVRFSWLTYQEQLDEIQRNQAQLREFTGYQPFFAVPYGAPPDWNTDTLRACQAMELEFISAHGGVNRPVADSREVFRLGSGSMPPGDFPDFFYDRAAGAAPA